MPSSPPVQPQQDNSNIQYLIEAVIEKGLSIHVDEIRFQDELRTKGFGEKEDQKYNLKVYEALYLIHTKRLVLKNKKTEIDFNTLLERALKHDKDILTKFLVYRDLRSRGYIPKEGFGFGVDFRVYERGEYGKKPAKYVIFGVNEGTNMKTIEFFNAIEQITQMGKDPVVAVIERRGEVIYYKVSKLKFLENKKKTSTDTSVLG